ncbi:MAG: GTP:adenosylcobinamide-phosphate guanylyltransferase [halophilic archaeon J07HX5]|nr:MAG: GTP:adenosylcobinamide-phosphate guanylyltransferase [halophilic archaeon J07HX5]
MCGGQGRRLDAAVEKPLFEVGNQPMIDYVLGALADSALGPVRAVTSPQAPATQAHLNEQGIACVEAPGEGYVADLSYALDDVSTPALTVAADLPLLEPAVIDRVLAAYDGDSVAVYVPAAVKTALGVSYDRTAVCAGRPAVPAGINLVAGADERPHLSHDVRCAVNVNRQCDAAVAETLACADADGDAPAGGSDGS